MKSFLEAFRRESEAGEQPLAALESASHEVSDADLRTGLQNAVRLAQGHSVGPGPIHVNQVPGTLRLCLAVGFASGDVPRFMALASRILEHNRVFYENVHEERVNLARDRPDCLDVALQHEPRFFYSSFYWLAEAGIDLPNVLSTLKVDVVSQGLAYALRALLEEGPGAAVQWKEEYDPSFVEGMLAIEKEQRLDALLAACRRLGGVPD
jgi:hypothetical protein